MFSLPDINTTFRLEMSRTILRELPHTVHLQLCDVNFSQPMNISPSATLHRHTLVEDTIDLLLRVAEAGKYLRCVFAELGSIRIPHPFCRVVGRWWFDVRSDLPGEDVIWSIRCKSYALRFDREYATRIASRHERCNGRKQD